MGMEIHESSEMYLETIYILSQTKGNVRALDVAEYMSFSKPSVSRAVHLLEDKGYLTLTNENYLILTKAGEEIATKIYERHNILSAIFKKIGVSDEIAAQDACKIEHYISDETFDALKKYFSLD